LQLSASSQSEVVELPHGAPAVLFGCVHVPPEQTSLVHSFESAVQLDPLAWLLGRHTPDALQLSASSQTEVAALPHDAPAALFGCVHAPAAHMSLVHWFVSAVQPDPSE
jgi:hypothetical protein